MSSPDQKQRYSAQELLKEAFSILTAVEARMSNSENVRNAKEQVRNALTEKKNIEQAGQIEYQSTLEEIKSSRRRWDDVGHFTKNQ